MIAPAGSPGSDDATRREILDGLLHAPRSLPCRLFYDEVGAQLFERISELDEYYLTRAELSILQRDGPSIAAALGTRCRVIEPGSGSGVKSRLLLALLHDPVQYVPVDVACGQLQALTANLAAEFPYVDVTPVVADFAAGFDVPRSRRRPERTVVFFPGSTIGNLPPRQASSFLARMAQLCAPAGGILVGVDLPKDAATLELAYDDPRGVTASFNRNILVHINRLLGADFDPSAFDHRAEWQPAASRMELSLVATRPHRVRLGGECIIELARGEAIVTEHCYKYDVAAFRQIAVAARLEPQRVWTDTAGRFTLHWLHAPRALSTVAGAPRAASEAGQAVRPPAGAPPRSARP